MKEIRLLWLAVPVFLAIWLQGYFFSTWRPLGVVPNVMLLVVLYSGLSLKASETVALAVVGGLLLDLSSGTDFGLRMGFYCVLALAVLVSRRAGADYENLWIIMLVTVAGTVIYNLGVLAGVDEGLTGLFWSHVTGLVVREVALNLVLALALRPVVGRMYRAPAATGMR